MTCGPYRPISLVTYTARISSLYARSAVSPAPALAATFAVEVEASGDTEKARSARIVLRKEGPGGIVKQETVALRGAGTHDALVSWDLRGLVDLWWPVGYGQQVLYVAEVTLLAKVRGSSSACVSPVMCSSQDSSVLDVATQRIGFRRVELIQEPLQQPDQYGTGTTFLFEVNGVRIFMGGMSRPRRCTVYLTEACLRRVELDSGA